VRKLAAIGASTAAAVALGAGAWWAVDRSAEAQTTERGTCGGATWELSMEAEDGGIEVSAELQSAGPGERWEVALLRGEALLLEGTRTTDTGGEIDVDAFTSDDSADAAYTATFTPADGEPCTAALGS
jgi:hypothetical protein